MGKIANSVASKSLKTYFIQQLVQLVVYTIVIDQILLADQAGSSCGFYGPHRYNNSFFEVYILGDD